MKKKKFNADYRFELVLNKYDEKTQKVVFDRSKKFATGQDMYNWAHQMRPNWKFSE